MCAASAATSLCWIGPCHASTRSAQTTAQHASRKHCMLSPRSTPPCALPPPSKNCSEIHPSSRSGTTPAYAMSPAMAAAAAMRPGPYVPPASKSALALASRDTMSSPSPWCRHRRSALPTSCTARNDPTLPTPPFNCSTNESISSSHTAEPPIYAKANIVRGTSPVSRLPPTASRTASFVARSLYRLARGVDRKAWDD